MKHIKNFWEEWIDNYTEKVLEIVEDTYPEVDMGDIYEALEDDSDYDHKIYADFEDFYNNSDHGYIKCEKGREICLRLYNCFIQEVSQEALTEQLHEEIAQTHKWNNYSILHLIRGFLLNLTTSSFSSDKEV